MVLESFLSLLNPVRAEKWWWSMIAFGFFYSLLAYLFAYSVWKRELSFIWVFAIVMFFLPIFYRIMKLEESKDVKNMSEYKLLSEHSKAFLFFISLFIGITLAFATLYVFLPENLVELAYSRQTQTISDINNQVSGNAQVQLIFFNKVLKNNIRVLVAIVSSSLIFGSGAIFILTWNASVIGTAMGQVMKNTIDYLTFNVSSFFGAATLSVVRYFPHGLIEIGAYFVAALAGGIISMSIINGHYKNERFGYVVKDIVVLLGISVLMLVIAGLVEAFLTLPLYQFFEKMIIS